jgi:hypothetical protein
MPCAWPLLITPFPRASKGSHQTSLGLFLTDVTRLSYGPGTAPLSQCGTGSLTLTLPLKQASLYYPCQLASVMALSSREILRNCFFQ